MGRYANGQAVWIEPEGWRGHVVSCDGLYPPLLQASYDGLYLVSIDGQSRATWRRADELRPRAVEGPDPLALVDRHG